MKTAFNRILVPVDFSVSTEIAIRKAIGLIEEENGELHLLHVVKPKMGPSAKLIIGEAEKKMAQWARSIGNTMKGIKVNSTILRGLSVSRMIIRSAELLSPDLILIGRQGRAQRWLFRRSVSPDTIARESNCPVLTVKPGSMNSRTKIIVLPVRDFVPERKLELAILIARKCRAQVHLLVVGAGKEGNGDPSQPFLKTYHQLKEELHQPVGYFPISRHDTAKAALAYAESVQADMILLNPETESGIPGLSGSRHISDLIGNNSKIQVLDVQPY
jgi:nucleotide-binding universal stress UspA family protein